MKPVYALKCNQIPERIYAVFENQEDARKALGKKANCLKHRMGVNVIANEPDKFSFLLGWEEAQVTWYLETYNLYESADEYVGL